jgi:hypothetical protein
VTCFRNGDGFCEPPLEIWGPAALKELVVGLERRRKGVGPSTVFYVLRRKEVLPVGNGKVLMGANTPAEWEVINDLLERGSGVLS